MPHATRNPKPQFPNLKHPGWQGSVTGQHAFQQLQQGQQSMLLLLLLLLRQGGTCLEDPVSRVRHIKLPKMDQGSGSGVGLHLKGGCEVQCS